MAGYKREKNMGTKNEYKTSNTKEIDDIILFFSENQYPSFIRIPQLTKYYSLFYIIV